MNLAILTGRLCADPEIKYTQNEMMIARYRLAVNRFGKDAGTDFINCVAFDKRAQFANKYLEKGMKISVTGRIHTDSYTKQDGTKVYTTEIIINEQEFAESRSSDGGARNTQPEPEKMPEPANNGFIELPDDFDGLPFK